MNDFWIFVREYKWRIIGVLSGILLTVLIFTIGFWRTLLLAVIVAACYIAGKKLDNGGKESLDAALGELFRKK